MVLLACNSTVISLRPNVIIEYWLLIGNHTLPVKHNHQHAAVVDSSSKNCLWHLLCSAFDIWAMGLLLTFWLCLHNIWILYYSYYYYYYTQPFYCSSGICPGPPGWALSRYQKGKTRKVKTNLGLLEQETVSGSGICWAICKSAPHPRQPHQHPTTQFFYRPDALPAAQPTASKHWRHCYYY